MREIRFGVRLEVVPAARSAVVVVTDTVPSATGLANRCVRNLTSIPTGATTPSGQTDRNRGLRLASDVYWDGSVFLK